MQTTNNDNGASALDRRKENMGACGEKMAMAGSKSRLTQQAQRVKKLHMD
jgi:hypothetical protein